MKLWQLLKDDKNVRLLQLLIVGIPAMWAALTFVAERLLPEPDQTILIAAKDFVKGVGVNTSNPNDSNPKGCYKDLVFNEPPWNGRPNSVEYRAFIKRQEKYSILIEYAAQKTQERPVQIAVNGKLVAMNALTGDTGAGPDAWCNDHTRWENVGSVELKRGINSIVISRGDVFPHLKTIKLVLEDRG
jgi:hypothetical protein